MCMENSETYQFLVLKFGLASGIAKKCILHRCDNIMKVKGIRYVLIGPGLR